MRIGHGALALGLAIWCSAAQAEELQPAAQRMAASLVRQLDPARVGPLGVKPLEESGSARGSGIGKQTADAVAAALKPKLHGSEPALLVGEAIGADGAVKVAVRIVSMKGTALAAESAQIGEPRAPVESASVDVAMRKIADQLVEGFQRMPGDVRYRRLAVLPLTETGDEARKRELGAVVTAELSTSLRRDHGLLLVERAKLQQVMGEIKLGQSGAIDAASAPEIGKLSDAQALVIGSVAEAGDKYLIDARIVATETAETLASASTAVPSATLVAFSSEAVVLRSRKDALFRSLLIPGWGQIYNREPAKGFLFMGAVAVTLGGALALHELGVSAQNQYQTAQLGTQSPQAFALQVEALRQKAQDRYGQRNIALAVGGGLWLLNILDAYFSGVDGDRALGGPLSALTPAGALF